MQDSSRPLQNVAVAVAVAVAVDAKAREQPFLHHLGVWGNLKRKPEA